MFLPMKFWGTSDWLILDSRNVEHFLQVCSKHQNREKNKNFFSPLKFWGTSYWLILDPRNVEHFLQVCHFSLYGISKKKCFCCTLCTMRQHGGLKFYNLQPKFDKNLHLQKICKIYNLQFFQPIILYANNYYCHVCKQVHRGGEEKMRVRLRWN